MRRSHPVAKKGKRPLRNEEEEEEEEDVFALEEEQDEEEPAPSSSKKRRKKNDDEFVGSSSSSATQIDISADERKSLLSQLVRYMIFVDAKKQPIRREDIQKEIMSKGNYSKKRGLLDELLKEAAQHLEEIFGFELKEISASLPSDKITIDKKAKPGNKIWILRQKLHFSNNNNTNATQDSTQISDTMNKIIASEEDLSHIGFLFTVLAIIICHDQKISEPTLWEYLRKHCQIQKDKIHPVLGSVTKLMEQFVKQMYLIHKKDKPAVTSRTGSTATEEAVPYFYTLGPRAVNEIMSKLNILEFLSSVTGNTISKSTRSRLLNEESKQNTQQQHQPLQQDEE